MHTPTLHRLGAERDACGIGFVADLKGRPSRRILDLLLQGLAAVKHRGATNADGKTSDGAGVLLPLSPAMVAAPRAGLAMVFLYDESARELVERACLLEGMRLAGWREVPVDACQLGERARATQPHILQLNLLRPPELDDEEVELRAFRARKRIEREAGSRVHVVSLSFRTVTYKGLVAPDELPHFYRDLQNSEIEIPFGIFHQRFATNTTPTWERAQPFRFLCHNGEINALRGNVNWMRARERRLGSFDDAALAPLIEDPEADSRTLDNALELLVRGERDVRHAVSMLVPEAWEGNPELDDEVRDFYRYHECLIEPWDGPAGLIFTDGLVVGAALDRNGLRPLRYAIRSDGIVVCASEAGIVGVPEGVRVKRGKLGPGQMIAVDPANGGFLESDYIKKRLARYLPYGRWLDENLRPVSVGEPCEPPGEDLLRRQVAFGVTREELSLVVRAIGSTGHEPISSMGDDAAITPLANRARLLPGYFKQRFAQVSNPPIDHLRERVIFSLRTLLGERAPLLTEGPGAAKLIELESFFLYPSALEELDTVRLDATFDEQEGLRAACLRLGEQATALADSGNVMLLVSDAGISAERAAVPILLAVGTIHQRLVEAGLRTRASILVESNEPRETHHFATLLGFGAEAICPRLALETMAERAAADKIGGDRPDPATAQRRYRSAIEDGILKIMSKMGISDVASYRGAQIFQAIGLAREVVELAFTRTESPLGGVGFAELEADAWVRMRAAFGGEEPRLSNPGYVKWRKGAEEHATSVPVVEALHATAEKAGGEAAELLARIDQAGREAIYELRKAIGGEGWQSYERFAQLVNGRSPLEIRDLLELVPAGEALPLEEVEPVEAIVRRFSGGAMSHGALSAEAHETVALGLNMIGARANSGEGGEDPARYHTERASLIKQVASGRFGVTPAYLRSARELQIKMAQGSKPGEGGQLPGHKVSAEIARLRHTEPGIALISPPPHHDIYSIEDLAQLIFDLRQVHPGADVSVKLVSEQGVGIVAAGVVKALADVVQISGCDGGTGASPLSSIKNAGAPWELGLAETQQALVSEGLRGRARVRVDGGFKTGRDVVVAALLGADEYAFGTALLLAEGCLMVRSCHLDTCPVGIASQRRDLRDRFTGTPEKVATYVLFVAEEVRRILAAMGLRSLEEAIGRTDLLRQRASGHPRVDLLDLSPLLARAGEGPTRYVGESQPVSVGGELGRRLAVEAASMVDSEARVALEYEISVQDRTVGATLGGDIGERHGLGSPPGLARVRFRGSAGQSFGAFLSDGVLFELEGEANDYVGKGMRGGIIAIRPPADDLGDPHLLGNTVLYGATGGELYVAGRAGERYAVRNSGSISVVEGTGDHPCEYMTAGTVVILGPFGRNVAAGMSGGQIFVYDPEELLGYRLNRDLVQARRLDEVEAASLHDLLTRHHGFTGSSKARDLLDDWPASVRAFWRVRPKAEVAKLEEEHEGTVTHAQD